jgi:gamma-glutamyl phosphate reductase
VLGLLCAAIPAAWAQAPSAADQAQVKAYVDMMRKDIRKEAQSIVDAAMDLEAADKARFWGVYEKYQKEMTGTWDQRMANIKKYAQNFEKLSDPVAEELANTSLNIESQVTAIRKKYYGLMKAALGPKVAARFLQVEASLNHILMLQLASQIPLIE